MVHAKMRLISTYLKKSLKKNSVNSNGFSMLEAVVVVGVLLALAVSGFIAYGPITDNAKHAVVKSEASKIYTAATVAQVDGDPSTTMATVLDDYNNSTDKIRILVRRSTDTDFTSTPDASFDSAEGDYCIRAEQIGDESIYSETGMCVAPGDGSGDPGDGSGDPGDGIPPENPASNSNALTILSYKCDSTKQVDSPFYSSVTGVETWSDGVTATYSGAFNPAPRTLQAGVDYTVTFKGTYASFASTSDTCVRSLDRWDDGTGVTRAAYAFKGASNLTSVPESIPSTLQDMSYMFASDGSFNAPNVSKWNTANVTNMSYMFSDATAFNQPLASWVTSKVTDMSSMFHAASNFNQPLNSWSTGNVTSMSNMFEDAALFDQPLNNWNTASVTSMNTMFGAANAFNQPIGTWNTGNVTDMSYMFGSNTAFQQSVNSWDTSKVTDFSGMFSYTSYNQPLNNWNTSSATKIDNMFVSNTEFNQSLNSWNVSNVTDMHGMFWGASSFNQPLNNWDTSNATNMSVMFSSAGAFDQPLNNWKTSKVEDMRQMFMMAFSFNQDLSSWNTSSVSSSGRSDFATWADSWTLPKPTGF